VTFLTILYLSNHKGFFRQENLNIRRTKYLSWNTERQLAKLRLELNLGWRLVVLVLLCLHMFLTPKFIYLFFYIHVTMHRNKFLFNKTNSRTNSPNLFLSRNSTCFGQFLCPSSGVFHFTFGTGICHAGLMTYTSAECTVENSW